MRTTVVLTLGVIGAGLGLLGDVIFWQGTPQTPPVLAVAGLLVGLLLGWLLSATFPRRRPRRRVDPSQYPNRLIRRD
jgi:membrane associated rhomboid family serine protease